ncbi:putative serine/threonine-protein kinase [Gossypium arboreum]|uniref:Putative serine/threonine-protein kinase n=1 Tax=Gossypium arboreum TaxID=29729 RepID=A0A0B0N7C0_GOSAR|nr:putative serine/threonine-protein kinase [Gossypium arboreum]
MEKRGRCQCHIPDMVIHETLINANAMSQTWSYMGSHISMLMPYPRYGLIRDLINPKAMIIVPKIFLRFNRRPSTQTFVGQHRQYLQRKIYNSCNIKC